MASQLSFAAAAGGDPAAARPTILLVEDNADMALAYGMILETKGRYRVVHVTDGLKAIRVLETDKVDLVITDILMPNEDGLGLLRAINRLRPGTPVIAMSGGSPVLGMDLLQVATQLGATVGLAKPIAPGQLLEHVAKLTAAPPSGGPA